MCPTYEYYCDNCQETTAILYSTVEEAKKCEKKEVCYRCGSKVTKVMSVPGKAVIK